MLFTGPPAIIYATFLLTSFCLVHSQGSVRLLLVDSDLRVMESASNVTTFGRVEGDATENLTVTVIPLTVAQYQANPSRYRNSCDSIIARSTSIDPAEESDFIGQPMDTQIPSDALGPGQSYKFIVDIGLIDDTIRESEEYFLLFLNASQSPPVDTIEYDSVRDCIRISIEDQDSFSVSYVPLINPIVVREDGGTVELLRIEKQGQAEIPVDVTFSGADEGLFKITPDALTLLPNETSAIVSITTVDNQFAEYDNTSVTVSADSTFGSDSIHITILDDERVEVGFDQTKVTVIEGETVTLGTSFKNIDKNYFLRVPSLFEVFTLQGTGNATESHYTSLSDDEYVVGNPIEIQTINDSKLERPRQFEVKLSYSVSTPLVIVELDTVIVTIKDRDGEPNRPNIVSVGKEKDGFTITWNIDRHELRPVDTYIVIIQMTESRNQDSSSSKDLETVEFNATVSATDANCKLNGTKDHCMFILLNEDIDSDKIHNITVCANNDGGQNCSDPTFIQPVPRPEEPNKPNIVRVGKEEESFTITWNIDKHELRPVDTYLVIIQMTESRNQDSSNSEDLEIVEFTKMVSATDANCKPNGTKDHCTLILPKEDIDSDKIHNITVCANNDAGQNCSDPTFIQPVPRPVSSPPGDRLPTGSIVGIIFGVIVAVLVCCLLWMLIALIICCCGCAEREKVYNPEKKEKENEKLRNKEMYTKVDMSESPTNEYDFDLV